ncbi:uncharacterized protein [Spinacia oleracea]|uniref:Uncharacterized protein isoform X2 n=1 Tax=Spinacia oleracea TaxID=3562 RepID=A0A9R0K8A9_SPIOL|nr:uncharacterized protein LOC110801166 isoform X2 [Spinacia oleracea]
MSETYLLSIILVISLSLTWFAAFGSVTKTPPNPKINQYFRFDKKSDSWIPVKLPYNLVTCNNGNCTVVGSINQSPEKGDKTTRLKANKETYRRILPLRKRVSLTKMSDSSIWITGESGSIYERFWNGVQWVIAPHDLPVSVDPAISVFFVNQSILALSEAGFLYQLIENSQLVWTKLQPSVHQNLGEERELNMIKSGVVTKDGERIYFCTKNGSLLELVEAEPARWVNHGQPPGADVAAIADVGTIRSNLVFTISSAGDLYEHDKNSKPPWKKHIWRREGSAEEASLLPSRGCSGHGLAGASSISLFLLNKVGELVERRLNQRKWKWILHGNPEDELLTSITPVSEDESNEKYSVFLTTASGSILEYQIAKQTGVAQENQLEEPWVNHMHPPHAKVARGVAGIPYQFGRTLFPLDDGRIAELHLSGLGGEKSGPDHHHQLSIRKRSPSKYVWSILDAPETEGWNAEYCSEERGPTNCVMGVKEYETEDFTNTRSMTRRRRKGIQQNYLIPGISDIKLEKSVEEEQKMEENWVNVNFGMRVIQGGRSFFLVSNTGLTYEYLYNDNVGLWLKHDHLTVMSGAVGSYNGSLFLVNIDGTLLIRERSNNELQWINCTAMKKGKEIIGGPPWDRIHGIGKKITVNDAIYFVSKNGRLLQFTVALRNFKWKDCKNPKNTEIATIVDQEVCRDKIVFVIGRNGRLYQYNGLSGLWHEHHQSQHLVLSILPGTAMRLSAVSLESSLFMISGDGGLIEYHWNSLDGWIWVEHGTPNGVRIAGAPGPSFAGHQLFLVGSDGKVYLRHFDQGEWKWRDCGFPDLESMSVEQEREEKLKNRNEESMCVNTDSLDNAEEAKLRNTNKICDPKLSAHTQVAPTRAIHSAENKVIFELRDGRLAEMQRVEDSGWIWSKIIATPTSLCMANFWGAAAAS